MDVTDTGIVTLTDRRCVVCGKKAWKLAFIIMKIKRYGRHYVYILQCSDNTYYTGYTPKIKIRVKLHNAGKGAKYTRTRLPAKLVWHKKYKYFKKAFLEELRIKKLTRKQKEKLINGSK